MRKFEVYTIGRQDSADIIFSDPSVSRLQAELLVCASGNLFLTACSGTSNTYRLRSGQRELIQQAYVEPTDRLRFGRLEVPVEDLLAALPSTSIGKRQVSASAKDELPVGAVRRDAATGEILGLEE